MNKPVWTLAVGVVLGFLLFLLYDVMKDDGGDSKLFDLKADTLSVNKGNADVEALNERLSALEDSVSFTNQALERIDARLSQLILASTESEGDDSAAQASGENRVPIPAKPVKQDEQDEGKKNWMDFVDVSLTRALVEYGMTPYDRDVPPILRKAVDELNKVSREYSKKRAEFSERWKGVEYKNSTDPALEQQRAEDYALRKWRNDERAPVLNSFRASLEELEKNRR